MNIAVLLFTLCLASPAAAAPPPWALSAPADDPDSPAVAKAWQALAAGLTEEGLALMKQAAVSAPDDVLIQRQYQIAMRNAGRYEELRAEFERRLAERPKDARAHLLAAELEAKVERYKELVRRGASLAPADPWLASSVKLLPVFERLAKGGSPKKALSELEAYEKPPRNLALYRGALFNAYLSAERFDDARAVAKALIDQYPHSAQGHVLAAFAAAAHGDDASALKAIEDGLAIRDAVDLRVLRGQVLWARGDRERSLAEFDRATRSPKDDSCWECAMIIAYNYLGEFAKSAALAPKAFTDRPWDASVRAAAAAAMLRVGKIDEAVETARAILKLRPGDSNGEMTLGLAASIQGRYEEALEAFSRALKGNPDNPAIRAARALTRFHMGRQQEGLQELVDALVDAPTHPEVLEAAVTVATAFEQADTIFASLASRAASEQTAVDPLAASAMLYARRRWFSHARADLKRAFDRVNDDRTGALVKQTSNLVEALEKFDKEGYPLDHADRPLVLAPGGVDAHFPLLYAAEDALWVGHPWRSPATRLWVDEATADPRTHFEWSGDGKKVFISSGPVSEIDIDRGTSRILSSAPKDGETIRLAYSRTHDRLTRLVERTVDGAPKLELEWLDSKTGAVVDTFDNPVHFPGRYTSANGKWGVEHLGAVFFDPELTRVFFKDDSEESFGLHGARPALSPDGRKLAFVFQGRQLRLYDLRTGELESLVFADSPTPGYAPLDRIIAEGPVWDPEGRHLFASVLDNSSMMSVVIDLKKRVYWRSSVLWTHAAWGPTERKK